MFTKNKNTLNRRLWTEDDELAIEEMVVKLGAGLLIFTAVITMFCWFSVNTVRAESEKQTAQIERLYSMYTDNLVSPEMAAYLTGPGSGQVISEEDLD